MKNITRIYEIMPGMQVKVKGDPVLHKCLSNQVYDEDGPNDPWGMKLEHAPRMEYYDYLKHRYDEDSYWDYAYAECIEYAVPPIPPGYIAIEDSSKTVQLIQVASEN
jgi:hypothetical protein